MVGGKQGHVPCEILSLQQSLLFRSVDYYGDHKAVTKLWSIRPPPVLGTLPNYKGMPLVKYFRSNKASYLGQLIIMELIRLLQSCGQSGHPPVFGTLPNYKGMPLVKYVCSNKASFWCQSIIVEIIRLLQSCGQSGQPQFWVHYQITKGKPLVKYFCSNKASFMCQSNFMEIIGLLQR